jgi:hypothetical protein
MVALSGWQVESTVGLMRLAPMAALGHLQTLSELASDVRFGAVSGLRSRGF